MGINKEVDIQVVKKLVAGMLEHSTNIDDEINKTMMDEGQECSSKTWFYELESKVRGGDLVSTEDVLFTCKVNVVFTWERSASAGSLLVELTMIGTYEKLSVSVPKRIASEPKEGLAAVIRKAVQLLS